MERYDPEVDLWSFVLPMNCGKVGACAVELKGKIYVIGENNDTIHSGSVRFMMYKPTSGAWLKVF